MVRCALSVSLSLPPSLYDCIAAREGRACSVLTSASLCLPVFEEALRVCEFVRLRLDLISSIHGCGSVVRVLEWSAVQLRRAARADWTGVQPAREPAKPEAVQGGRVFSEL